MLTVKVEQLYHRDARRLAVRFAFNPDLQRVLKTLPDARFSKTHKCWYVDDTAGKADALVKLFKGIAYLEFAWLNTGKEKDNRVAHVLAGKAEPHPAHAEAIKLMEQKLKLKGYAPSTIRTYVEQFILFLRFFPDSHPADLGEEEIGTYLLFLVDKRKVAKSTQNQAINAVKFFYEKVLRQERKVYYVERPMRERKLPEILSEQEVMALFEAAGNLKHRLMLMIIYSAGLRRSELLGLRTGDVDMDRRLVLVRGGKGRKDRHTLLAASVVPLLKQYLDEYEPAFWLFEGLRGQRYSETSLQAVLKRAAAVAGIRKNVHLHMLRHSFATHLLEGGTSTRYIQVLLGHESPKTTEIYAQVTRFGLDKVMSPLDQIVHSKKLRGDGE